VNITTDQNASIRFLRLIDPRAERFTFQTFKEPGDNNPHVWPNVIHAADLIEIEAEHDKGAGIYLTVNETDGQGRKTENIVRVRAVWQEDDDGYDGAFPLAPSIVVESSPGHFHRYWLVSDDWPTDDSGRADFAAVMGRMVETYGSDPNAKDTSRVLRLPGFLHRKSDPFMVRIVEASGQRYGRADIVAAFPAVKREIKEPPGAQEWCGQKGDGWLRGLVRTVAGAAEGERNQVLYWASCRAGEAVRDGRASGAFIIDVLIEAAAHAGLTRREAESTIRSGLRMTGGRA